MTTYFIKKTKNEQKSAHNKSESPFAVLKRN